MLKFKAKVRYDKKISSSRYPTPNVVLKVKSDKQFRKLLRDLYTLYNFVDNFITMRTIIDVTFIDL